MESFRAAKRGAYGEATSDPLNIRSGEYLIKAVCVGYVTFTGKVRLTNRDGVATVETVSEMWGEAERTMYRRLEEFREVWAPAGYETPDPIADVLIADYRARKQKLSAIQLPRLLGTSVPLPTGAAAWADS